jgi:outer membrane receptor protein involved in Fe transport
MAGQRELQDGWRLASLCKHRQGLQVRQLSLAQREQLTAVRPVSQESLLAYEVGVKAPISGGMVRVEASGFYYDYRNKQVRGRVADPVFGAVEALVNIPKSRVFGFQGSLRARPARGLDLGVSAVVVDSKVQRFTGYDQNGVLTDFAGSPFPIRPASRWSRTRPTNGLSGLTFAALWAPI